MSSFLFFSNRLLLEREIKDESEVAKRRLLGFKEEERREGLNILSGNEGVTSTYIRVEI